MNEQPKSNHEHCYHAIRGVIHMVVPDGHIVQKCCKCEATRVIHADHAHERTLSVENGRRATITECIRANHVRESDQIGDIEGHYVSEVPWLPR